MIETPFSVILPVYYKDRPDWLKVALNSLLEQTLAPAEIIVIEDGPLNEALSKLLLDYCAKYSIIRRFSLNANMGLPSALNAGLMEASHTWVARMDADDCCESNRFEIQFKYLNQHPEISIISSWIDEYDEDLKSFVGRRKLPESHSEIMRYAKWRSPFNHMAVLYKKEMVLSLGGYNTQLRSGQDYELWSRVLMGGYKGANIPSSLIKARTGKDFYSNRRRGWKHLKNEYKVTQAIYQSGLFSWPIYLTHIILKTIIRLFPPAMIRFIYKRMRSSS